MEGRPAFVETREHKMDAFQGLHYLAVIGTGFLDCSPELQHVSCAVVVVS